MVNAPIDVSTNQTKVIFCYLCVCLIPFLVYWFLHEWNRQYRNSRWRKKNNAFLFWNQMRSRSAVTCWRIIYWFSQCLIVFDWRFHCDWHFNCGNISQSRHLLSMKSFRFGQNHAENWESIISNSETTSSACVLYEWTSSVVHASSIKFTYHRSIEQHDAPFNKCGLPKMLHLFFSFLSDEWFIHVFTVGSVR